MDIRRHPALDWDGDVSMKERKTAMFGFPTHADRLAFIERIRKDRHSIRFATALLPDTQADKRWLVAVPLDQDDVCTSETPLNVMLCDSTVQ
jgi:hypothetical protein